MLVVLKDYLFVFLSGLALSFTPCVYPVIPITLGFFAYLNSEGSRLKGFFISLIYVFGLAITYSAMGIVTALSGRHFGYFQNTPYVFLFVATVLILFSFVMFDKLHIPTISLSFHDKIKTRNIWTVILFGMASGLVVSSCTVPVLAAILGEIARRKNLGYAVTSMFVFSYGVGASLILLGTFSGLVSRMPKPGKWMVYVKNAGGAIIFMLGLFYLYKALSLFY